MKKSSLCMNRAAIVLLLGVILVVCFIATSSNKARAASRSEWRGAEELNETVKGNRYCGVKNKKKKICWVKWIDIGKKKKKKFVIPDKIDGMTVVEIGGMETDDFSANVFGTLAEIAHGLDGEDSSTNHITEIVLPDSIKRIHDTAFSGLKIKSIHLPKELKKLEWCTFYGCSKLESVYISQNLTTIESGCFERCNKLKKISVSKDNPNIKEKNMCILDKKGKLMAVCSQKKNIVVPEGVTNISGSVFRSLKCTKVSLPSTLREIENEGLTSFTIQEVNLSGSNKYLKRDGQTIYRVKDKSLAVIICPKGKKYKMSDKVELFKNKVSVIAKMLYDTDSEGPYFKSAVLSKNLKRIKKYGFWWSDSIEDKIVYTASKPPVVEKHPAGYTPLPVGFYHIVVPKKSNKLYKQWYKKFDVSVDEWSTSPK